MSFQAPEIKVSLWIIRCVWMCAANAVGGLPGLFVASTCGGMSIVEVKSQRESVTHSTRIYGL